MFRLAGGFLMQRSFALVFLIVLSLLMPLANLLPGITPSYAQTKSSKPRGDKMAEGLRERIRQSRPDGTETTRVIIQLDETADPQQLNQSLVQLGGGRAKHLESLGLMVADMPLNK